MEAVPREFIEEGIKPMKCPFLENFKQVEQTTYDLNNDGVVESCQTILTENRTFADCVQYECAGWIDGRCQCVVKIRRN